MKGNIDLIKAKLSIYQSGIDGAIDGCSDANPENLISASQMLGELKENKKAIRVMYGLAQEVADDLAIIQNEYDQLPMRIKPIEEALNRLTGYKRQP